VAVTRFYGPEGFGGIWSCLFGVVGLLSAYPNIGRTWTAGVRQIAGSTDTSRWHYELTRVSCTPPSVGRMMARCRPGTTRARRPRRSGWSAIMPGTTRPSGRRSRRWRAAWATEAIRLYEQTLAAFERVLGPDHPDTLASRHNLANAYRPAGRVAEAIGLYEQVLADRERVLGPDHPSTLASRHNLANAYQAAGRAAEAIPLHEQVPADRERVLGPDHPSTLASRDNLAIAYQAAGRGGPKLWMLRRRAKRGL